MGFNDWWTAYPKKVGKLAAKREFDKLNPSEGLIQQMLDALAWQKDQPAWVKDGGEYIPHPRTWLHQGRWLDEPFNPPQTDLMTEPHLRLMPSTRESLTQRAFRAGRGQ